MAVTRKSASRARVTKRRVRRLRVPTTNRAKTKGDRRRLSKRRIGLRKHLKAIAYPPRRPCNEREICRFLRQFSRWVKREFIPDYENLRLAVCNVEDQAFSGAGVPNDRFPPCGGGTGGGPTPVVSPPLWT